MLYFRQKLNLIIRHHRKWVHLKQLQFNSLPTFIACTDMMFWKHFTAKTSIVNQDIRNLCKYLKLSKQIHQESETHIACKSNAARKIFSCRHWALKSRIPHEKNYFEGFDAQLLHLSISQIYGMDIITPPHQAGTDMLQIDL